jgi:hypothetical protein
MYFPSDVLVPLGVGIVLILAIVLSGINVPKVKSKVKSSKAYSVISELIKFPFSVVHLVFGIVFGLSYTFITAINDISRE